MILKFFLFIATILIVRSESLWTRLTSKPSLPSELQDLLDSLYIRGYIPEYILPEDELTETEKTEGEYLDFPDLKNAQDDVFVPPESEYSKNNMHFKNIKVHKRLIPMKSWNPKTVNNWEELLSSELSPDNLRMNLISHLTDNESGQNNNSKLDFLIPIPEKGTYQTAPTLIYPTLPTETLNNVQSPEQSMYNFNKIFYTNSANDSNKSTTQPSHYIYTFDTTRNYFSAKYPNPYKTTTKPPYFRPKPSQTMAVVIQAAQAQRVQQPPPVLTAVIAQNPLGMLVKQQPNLDVKKPPSNWNANILSGQQHQSGPAMLIKNRTQRRPTYILEKSELHSSTRRQNANVVENHIESKVVNQITNTSTIGKEDKLLIQTRIPFINENRNNIEKKIVSQTNCSYGQNSSGGQNHEVQVIENNLKIDTDQTRGKKKMFTFLNIFKKNKKHPGDSTQSIAVEGNKISGASSLSELYNQLKDTHTINDNYEFQNQDPIKHDLDYEEMLYHKRKK